jgi:hypothetical protein
MTSAAVRTPLLEQVRGLLERSYDHRTASLGSLAPFLVGDEGYRRLVASRQVVHTVGAEPGQDAGPGARLLVREGRGGRLRVNLYYPDQLIRTLERHDPGRRLNVHNVDAFATFVEELDHLLLLAARTPSGPPLTMLEMELHANVSKELVLRHFLARLGGLRRLPAAAVAWVRFHLFEKHRFSDRDRKVRQRYEDAARFAVRYLRHLDGLTPRLRLRDLRRFSRMSHGAKLRMIGEIT